MSREGKGVDTVCVNSQVSYLQGSPRKLYLARLREFLSEGKGARVFICSLIPCWRTLTDSSALLSPLELAELADSQSLRKPAQTGGAVSVEGYG